MAETAKQAKIALAAALRRLAEIEAEHNRRIKLPGADLAALDEARTRAEEALDIERLFDLARCGAA